MVIYQIIHLTMPRTAALCRGRGHRFPQRQKFTTFFFVLCKKKVRHESEEKFYLASRAACILGWKVSKVGPQHGRILKKAYHHTRKDCSDTDSTLRMTMKQADVKLPPTVLHLYKKCNPFSFPQYTAFHNLQLLLLPSSSCDSDAVCFEFSTTTPASIILKE